MKRNRNWLACVLAGICTVLGAAPLSEGLLFHAPFGEGSRAAFAGGSPQPQKELKTVPGRLYRSKPNRCGSTTSQISNCGPGPLPSG